MKATYSNMRGSKECKSGEIMVSLDGDDELLGRYVLKMINAKYQEGDYWLVYTSFIQSTLRFGKSKRVSKNFFGGCSKDWTHNWAGEDMVCGSVLEDQGGRPQDFKGRVFSHDIWWSWAFSPVGDGRAKPHILHERNLPLLQSLWEQRWPELRERLRHGAAENLVAPKGAIPAIVEIIW